jgi:DNA-binding transcriptional LysR family regulator
MTAKQFFSRDLKLRHLRLLVAIDDARQLSRVARLMHITQPSVSKTLAEIEASIGARLFERLPQGLLPTPLGAAMVRSARDVLAELDRAGAELEQISRGQSRSLLIGAMPSAALSILAPALASLQQADPELALRVSEGVTEDLLVQLQAGRLHAVLGARLRRALPDGVVAHPLYDDPLVFVAGPGHPAALREAMDWDELAGFAWILTPPAHPLRAGFERALRDQGMAMPRQVIDSSMMDLTIGLVAAGKVLALTARRQADYLQGLGLVRIVAAAHAERLGLDLKVALFTASVAGPQAEIGLLLDCLAQVLGSPKAANEEV